MRWLLFFLLLSSVAHPIVVPAGSCTIADDAPLTGKELRSIFAASLGLSTSDSRVLFLVDLPKQGERPSPIWLERITMAEQWAELLQAALPGVVVQVVTYLNVGRHVGQMPETGHIYNAGEGLPGFWKAGKNRLVSIARNVQSSDVVIALNQFSATGFLRQQARIQMEQQKDFKRPKILRAASMPGFHRGMIKGLRVDFADVERRALQFQELLQQATKAEIFFDVKQGAIKSPNLTIDLRLHPARRDSGIVSGALAENQEPVTNLPGGEAWKCPWEGSSAFATITRGLLPIQINNEVIMLSVTGNRARRVLTTGEESQKMQQRLFEEPALGNIAEFGAGVLVFSGVGPSELRGGDFPIRCWMRKFSIHIALGYNNHLGGNTFATAFSDPEKAEHTDYVYHPASQPLVALRRVVLTLNGDEAQKVTLVIDGKYNPSLFK